MTLAFSCSIFYHLSIFLENLAAWNCSISNMGKCFCTYAHNIIIYSLAPSGPFDVARTILFKPYEYLYVICMHDAQEPATSCPCQCIRLEPGYKSLIHPLFKIWLVYTRHISITRGGEITDTYTQTHSITISNVWSCR